MPPTSSDDFPAPASDTDQNAQLFVVSHTHWDREWYHTAEVFRLSLVDLVDELLDRNSASPFLLDGQAIVLEDYLSTRPGRREQVECALQSGTLEAGPWYVLGDSLIASGESMARNLFEGRRTLRALGAAPPRVLYCPDSFGHAAALPLLATGFGFPVLIAWRGIGEDESSSDTMRWRAKDGSEVLVYHLPRDGYEFGSSLPADDAGAAHRWERIRTQLLARSSLGVALLQNGADHHARQERLDDALASLARAADPTTITRASLADFARALVNRAATSTLPRIVGEQRDSTGYTWSLQGTFASRTPQKRANAKAERLLVRDVEPWLALAFWYGEPSRREESAAVWRTLLASHPHDTLCGCSIDAVAAAMDERLAQVMRAGTELAARARERIVGHDRALARGSSEAWMHSIIVRNAAPYARGGVVQLEVDVPIATVPVGPGSADAKVQESSPGAISIGEPAVALQLLSRERTFVRVESPRDYPRDILVERRRYLAWIHAVGPFSLAGLPVHQARVSHAKPPIAATIDSGDLRNEYLRVAVVDGQVCVETADGRTMMAVIGLEDVGERGDLYTHSPIPKTARQGRMMSHRITARGPLRAQLTTRWEIKVAPRALARATEEREAHPSATLRLTIALQLDAGSPFVRIAISGENSAKDHRLRVQVSSNIRQPRVFADAPFDAVRRQTSAELPRGDARESFPPTAPLHRFVTCIGDGRGVSLLSDGLGECEVSADGLMSVTLIRATGELSRRNLPERPGHAGWPAAVPQAQLLAPFEANLAIFPHGGAIDDALVSVEHACDDFLHPLHGESLLSMVAPPRHAPGVALSGDGLVFSSCKESEDGRGLVLRCRNVRNQIVDGSWALGGMREAFLSRLDETYLAVLSVRDDTVVFQAPPYAVVTIVVRSESATVDPVA